MLKTGLPAIKKRPQRIISTWNNLMALGFKKMGNCGNSFFSAPYSIMWKG